MNPLLELRQLGQSVWLDDIHRRFVTGGDLARLVREDGLGGVTSNPTIFEKAIGGSGEYDEALRIELSRDPAVDRRALFEALALEDIRMAADVLREVYERTEGNDGFVSFEVAPGFAHDTDATVSEARRLFAALGRPNVMIKVPATPEGIPAIEQLIADGININVTVMFSMAHYEAVAQAYIRGLERCARPAGVASVASFFVSRVDTVVDKALERLGTPDALALRGRAAVANCKLVYQRFRDLFHGASFAALRARGCRVQRPLWASTSTKNPAYRDVMYVEELVGVETVNTLPPATLAAFRDHGEVRGTTVDEDADAARAVLASIRRLGIDLDQVTSQLQADGVNAFARSYDDLLEALDGKRTQVGDAPSLDPAQFSLHSAGPAVTARIRQWQQDEVGRRIWDKDHSVWSPRPVPELTDRLGWLHMPEQMPQAVDAWIAFADEVRAAGIRHVILLGMGGSSLAPEVFEATFGHRDGYPGLIVLDSTHPDAVRHVEQRIELGKALFVVSSKSGTTGETNSFFKYFWSRFPEGQAGRHFAAITDPGTSLDRMARDRGFRAVFNAPADIGGRYSALTPFGLVPAALIGVDVRGLLRRAWQMAEASAPGVPVSENRPLVLGAALGELARAGRDKLTFLVDAPLASFPAWLEQLIAESTGKNDEGIVPIADEGPWPAEAYGSDRVFVVLSMTGESGAATAAARLDGRGHPVIRVHVQDRLDLGQEFFRWELATAAAGAVLGIQPFDQPDVQLAKDLARRAMEQAGSAAAGVAPPLEDAARWADALAAWLSSAKAGDYLSLHAYLAPRPGVTALLQELRDALGRPRRLATTVGYGPRFLHSTGQLHKGGPNSGLFLQLTDTPGTDLPVPETSYTFGELIAAQAAGDAMALGQRGRRLLRISVGKDVEAGMRRLVEIARALS